MSERMESTRTGFGHALLEIAQEREDILVTSADTYRSFALGEFVERFPDRYFEFGIAEQCMITASAGMASEGYTVFSVGYSPFLSMRAVEQIRTFCAYTNQNVKIVAGLGGLSGDTDGVTHQGTEDISMIRAIPNMMLVSPADSVAARAMTKMIADIKTPVYLRLGRGATPIIYDEDQTFELGKALTARDYGTDAAILATGYCVGEAMKAADALKEQGVGVRVLDFHTIKPFDTEAALKACADCGNIVVVEDGSIYGGLAGAVAETFVENGAAPKKFKRLGLTTFGTTGTVPQLAEFFGLDRKALEKTVKDMLG